MNLLTRRTFLGAAIATGMACATPGVIAQTGGGNRINLLGVEYESGVRRTQSTARLDHRRPTTLGLHGPGKLLILVRRDSQNGQQETSFPGIPGRVRGSSSFLLCPASSFRETMLAFLSNIPDSGTCPPFATDV